MLQVAKQQLACMSNISEVEITCSTATIMYMFVHKSVLSNIMTVSHVIVGGHVCVYENQFDLIRA